MDTLIESSKTRNFDPPPSIITNYQNPQNNLKNAKSIHLKKKQGVQQIILHPPPNPPSPKTSTTTPPQHHQQTMSTQPLPQNQDPTSITSFLETHPQKPTFLIIYASPRPSDGLSWCGDCRRAEPLITKKLAEKMREGRVMVVQAGSEVE